MKVHIFGFLTILMGTKKIVLSGSGFFLVAERVSVGETVDVCVLRWLQPKGLL